MFIHTRSNRMIAMIPERPAETRLERGADLEGTMSEYTDDSSHFYFVGGREDSRVSRSDSPPLDQLEYALRRDTVTDSVVSNNTASVTPSGRDIRRESISISSWLKRCLQNARRASYATKLCSPTLGPFSANFFPN